MGMVASQKASAVAREAARTCEEQQVWQSASSQFIETYQSCSISAISQ